MPPIYVLRSGPYERFLYLDAERPPQSLRHSLRAFGLGFGVQGFRWLVDSFSHERYVEVYRQDSQHMEPSQYAKN